MRDFLEALNDGMVAHRVRAWVYCTSGAVLLGLALCTWPLGLIPLSLWGAVLSAPFAWVAAGGFGWAMAKLLGLGLLLVALCVWLEVGSGQ